MTRNGVLQKVVVGVILLLVGLGVVGYFVYHEYLISSNPFALLGAGLGVALGATFVVGASILFGSAIGDWRTKRAFEQAFGVELPSWRRDFNSIQDMKRRAAQHKVAQALREAKSDFQVWAVKEGHGWADEEKLLRRATVNAGVDEFQEPAVKALRSLVATIQEKKKIFFRLRNLALKCGIAIPQELQRLKPADQLKAAVR